MGSRSQWFSPSVASGHRWASRVLWYRAPGDRGALGPVQAWLPPSLLFRVGCSLHPACDRWCESPCRCGPGLCWSLPWARNPDHPSASVSCCPWSRCPGLFRARLPTNVCPFLQRQSDVGRGANRRRNQMSGDTCVQTWPCSYYLELEKRWVPGRLSLTSLSLKFMTDKTRETLVSFPLSSIIEIKKEASHFIFSSITILERDHSKHWFSSLQPSRNAVFSVIEHFWRELLLSESGAAAEAASSSMTKGKELTCLMACTQKRLEDTARVLHHQGEQLDGISRGLDKMESDLDVADR